jgi:hypothetical protein
MSFNSLVRHCADYTALLDNGCSEDGEFNIDKILSSFPQLNVGATWPDKISITQRIFTVVTILNHPPPHTVKKTANNTDTVVISPFQKVT